MEGSMQNTFNSCKIIIRALYGEKVTVKKKSKVVKEDSKIHPQMQVILLQTEMESLKKVRKLLSLKKTGRQKKPLSLKTVVPLSLLADFYSILAYVSMVR